MFSCDALAVELQNYSAEPWLQGSIESRPIAVKSLPTTKMEIAIVALMSLKNLYPTFLPPLSLACTYPMCQAQQSTYCSLKLSVYLPGDLLLILVLLSISFVFLVFLPLYHHSTRDRPSSQVPAQIPKKSLQIFPS